MLLLRFFKPLYEWDAGSFSEYASVSMIGILDQFRNVLNLEFTEGGEQVGAYLGDLAYGGSEYDSIGKDNPHAKGFYKVFTKRMGILDSFFSVARELYAKFFKKFLNKN